MVEELDGWVKVAIEEGDGYVSREYVNLRTDFVHAESKEEEEARLSIRINRALRLRRRAFLIPNAKRNKASGSGAGKAASLLSALT